MNYTNIIIEGKQYGLRFGMNAVRDMDGVDLTDSIKSSAKLLLASHRNFCEVKEIEPLMTYQDAYDFVESSFMTQNESAIAQIQDVWEGFNKTLAPFTEGDKKKQTGKRSKKQPSVS